MFLKQKNVSTFLMYILRIKKREKKLNVDARITF